jgi:hypothetical protein
MSSHRFAKPAQSVRSGTTVWEKLVGQFGGCWFEMPPAISSMDKLLNDFRVKCVFIALHQSFLCFSQAG